MSDNEHYTKSKGIEEKLEEGEEHVIVQRSNKDVETNKDYEYNQAEVALNKTLPMGPQGN